MKFGAICPKLFIHEYLPRIDTSCLLFKGYFESRNNFYKNEYPSTCTCTQISSLALHMSYHFANYAGDEIDNEPDDYEPGGEM